MVIYHTHIKFEINQMHCLDTVGFVHMHTHPYITVKITHMNSEYFKLYVKVSKSDFFHGCMYSLHDACSESENKTLHNVKY